MIDVSRLGVDLKMKDIDLDTLIADAVERKNKEAFDFLEKASKEKVVRKTRGGESIECLRSISSYRAEYLKLYCGYKTNSSKELTEAEKKAIKERAKAKKAKVIADKFANARALFETNT